MERFLNNRELTRSPRSNDFINVYFEAFTEPVCENRRGCSAGIGYTIHIGETVYQVMRNIGLDWEYNQALALAVLDSIEALEHHKDKKIKFYHRGHRFHMYFNGLSDIPDNLKSLFDEVRSQLSTFKYFKLICVDKSRLSREKGLAYTACKRRDLTIRNLRLNRN